MKNVAFCTLGCKVNQYETNGMMQKFINCGYHIVKFDEFADIYVINTCTVTNMADKKSRQMLRRVKEINQNAVVVAVGCYAQVAKDNLEKIDDVDIILGNNEKAEIVKYVEDYIKLNKKLYSMTDLMQQKEYTDFGSVTYTEKTRAVIKVQDGCDRFCSYCIIPYARGRVRSRDPKNVIEEITKIAQNGIKEVVITGIHVASYGKDFKEDYKLIDLLEDINKIEGIKRIRLGSLEPTIITDDFVKRLKKLEKICDHFHLSLQSGCDETLKRMNRRYTTEEFRIVCDLLRKAYPNVCLTTDIIVGFPGETEEEFNKTYEFLKEIKFYKMHVFKYSPRKGTKAENMENQVDGNIKELRSQKLIDLSNFNEKMYNNTYIGKELEVLFEEKEDGFYKGHTKNYLVVQVKSDKELENTIKDVNIVEANSEFLKGIIVRK